MKNRIKDAETLKNLLPLEAKQLQDIQAVGETYRWALSPYYLSLIDKNDPNDPIRLQSVPSVQELKDDLGEDDPMGEAFTSPAPCITRRYPDRLIINVTNICAMYCRHCQRRRNIGEIDVHETRSRLQAALEYVRNNPEIRDVLVTGGDALLLSDQTLDWLLNELHQIPHVEIKRIGTRVPVTLPMRITDELCRILEKYPPIYINTQFNHPKEVTEEAKKAADKLIKAGVVLGNQAVLLKGINDQPDIMKRLNQELLKIRVRPYYIFHAKNVKGTSHFIPKIQDGLEIMEKLRGYTSGLAIPTYIINAPGGGGKTPILPQYLVSLNDHEAILRTWEGNIIHYPNH
jgi:lysine 2,3-aminomutase